MKKVILLILSILCVVSCAIGIVGCNDGSSEQCDITVDCERNGSYTLSAQSPVVENTSVTLTIKPNYGFQTDVVKVNDSKVDITDNKYTFTVKGDTNISITFKAIEPQVTKFNVSVTKGEHGDYLISQEGEVAENTEVTLTVLPDNGYVVDKVEVNGSIVDLIDNKYTFTVKGDTNIYITFKLTAPQVTKFNVSVTKGEHGDYLISHKGKVAENTEVTLTVTPEDDYEVNSVTVNGVEVTLVGNRYTFTVTEDTVIIITFKEKGAAKQFNVRVDCDNNGTYSISNEGLVAQETTLTLTVTPHDGFVVDEVKVNDVAIEHKDDGMYANVYEIVVHGETIITISFKEDIVGPHEHSFDKDWEPQTPPTYDYGGILLNTCAICGKLIEIHIPDLDAIDEKGEEVYTKSGDTASCTDPGTASFTIYVEEIGQTLTFKASTPPLGHLVDDNGNCTRPGCNETDIGIFDSRLKGTWETDGILIGVSKKTILIGKDSISYNGVVASEVSVDDEDFNLFYFTIDKIKYTAKVLGDSMLHITYRPDPNSPDVSLGQFYRNDSALFSEDVVGTWKSDNSSAKTIYFSNFTFMFGEVEVLNIGTLNKTNDGFTFTFSVSGEMDGDSNSYNLAYSKATTAAAAKITISSVGKNHPSVFSYTKSSDTIDLNFGVAIDSKYAGVYVSENKKYTIVVDQEGRLTFNGTRVSLDIGPNSDYQFIYDGAVYQFKPSTTAGQVFISSVPLGIGRTYLYLQQ